MFGVLQNKKGQDLIGIIVIAIIVIAIALLMFLVFRKMFHIG